MVRRIRWQILIAVCTALIVSGLLGAFAVSSSATSQPLQGRVYVEGVVGEVRQLNPLVQRPDTSQAERDLAALLFEGLTRIGPDGRAVPALAESWTVSQDGRIYTFRLRQDRIWHDGVPVTADDVLYTVRGVQNASFPGDPALPPLWRDVLVSKLDARSVRFELSTPFAPFPSIARLPILPAHLLRTLRPEQWPTAPFSQRPVGTGPLMLRALDAKQVLLVPFPGYSGPRPSLDHLLLRLYATPDSAVLDLNRREVQGVATVATAGRRAPDPAAHTRRAQLPLGDYTLLAFNVQQQPLDDPQLRQALALAINRDLLITNVLGGQGQRLDTPILPGTWAAAPDVQLPAYRRSAAQQLLGQLGYVDANGDGWLEAGGQRFVLPLLIADTPEQETIAGEITRQLRAIGVGIEVRRVAPDALQLDLARHNFTLAVHSWSGVGADPDVYALWHSSRANGGTNYAGLRDPRIDQLLSDGRATSDEARRRAIYAEFQRRWVELIPSLPLYQSVLTYNLDQRLQLPSAPPALTLARAERFATLPDWQVPPR